MKRKKYMIRKYFDRGNIKDYGFSNRVEENGKEKKSMNARAITSCDIL